MSYIRVILCSLFMSSQAFSSGGMTDQSGQSFSSGGMTGGTGIGGLISDLNQSIQEALKLPELKLDSDTLRRLIIRLAICGEATIKINGKTITIKTKFGRPISITESYDEAYDPEY